jgi:hypothetical protein
MQVRILSAIFVLIAVLVPIQAAAQGAVLGEAEKIRAAANTYSSSPRTIVVVKMKDGRSYKGRIERVEADRFTLYDPNSSRSVELAYADVSKLKKSGMSAAAKTAIWVGVGAGVGALIIFGRRQRPLGTICPLGCGL